MYDSTVTAWARYGALLLASRMEGRGHRGRGKWLGTMLHIVQQIKQHKKWAAQFPLFYVGHPLHMHTPLSIWLTHYQQYVEKLDLTSIELDSGSLHRWEYM